MKSFSRTLCIGVLISLICLACNSAPKENSPDTEKQSTTQPASALADQPISKSSMHIQVYNILDLLATKVCWGTSDSPRTKYLYALIDCIQKQIAPESWDVHGGTAVLSELNGHLVITQTPENHKKIEAFLAKRRAETAAATPPASAFADSLTE